MSIEERMPLAAATIHDVLALRRPLVIGHRGAAAVAPENTLAAFRAGLAAGADLVELDYHHTADGVPVVLHDDALDRTTGAAARWGRSNVRVDTIQLAELAGLDAGSWFGARFAGESVPTLEEALRLICRDRLAAIEHKQGDAATLVELLRRLSLIDRVAVMSFDWTFLAACHGLSTELVLVALGDGDFHPAVLADVENIQATLVGWNQEYVARPQVEAIRQRGRRLWVYTVNDTARAKELAALGVSGLITDDPAAIRVGLQSTP